MSNLLRPELGNYSSIVCLKAIITGMEDALGEKATAIALITAGRSRGKALAKQLGLSLEKFSLKELANKLSMALGQHGTRLLVLDKIELKEDTFKVYTTETVCSAGENDGSSRLCTFTLGAIQGALEFITDSRLRGTHIESVLRGGTHDVFEYIPIEKAFMRT